MWIGSPPGEAAWGEAGGVWHCRLETVSWFQHDPEAEEQTSGTEPASQAGERSDRPPALPEPAAWLPGEMPIM